MCQKVRYVEKPHYGVKNFDILITRVRRESGKRHGFSVESEELTVVVFNGYNRLDTYVVTMYGLPVFQYK